MEAGTSLVVQWLKPGASTTGGMDSIPGARLGNENPAWCLHSQKKRRKEKKKWRQACLNMNLHM